MNDYERALAMREANIAKLKENLHFGYGALGVIGALASLVLFCAAFLADGARVGAAAQSLATAIAAVALIIAIWAVVVAKSVAKEINSLSLEQRRSAAHTEINRMWQQLNVDVYKGDIVLTDSNPDPNAKEVKSERLIWVHILLGILRQIWIFQKSENFTEEFWEIPARYWSNRVRTAYPAEWHFIVTEHRGYDLDFLRQVVAWSIREQPDPEELRAIARSPAVEDAVPNPRASDIA